MIILMFCTSLSSTTFGIRLLVDAAAHASMGAALDTGCTVAYDACMHCAMQKAGSICNDHHVTLCMVHGAYRQAALLRSAAALQVRQCAQLLHIVQLLLEQTSAMHAMLPAAVVLQPGNPTQLLLQCMQLAHIVQSLHLSCICRVYCNVLGPYSISDSQFVLPRCLPSQCCSQRSNLAVEGSKGCSAVSAGLGAAAVA